MMQRWRVEALACFLFILFSEIRCQKGDPAAGTAGASKPADNGLFEGTSIIIIHLALANSIAISAGATRAGNMCQLEGRELTFLRRLLLCVNVQCDEVMHDSDTLHIEIAILAPKFELLCTLEQICHTSIEFIAHQAAIARDLMWWVHAGMFNVMCGVLFDGSLNVKRQERRIMTHCKQHPRCRLTLPFGLGGSNEHRGAGLGGI